jgi:hypothetical protein
MNLYPKTSYKSQLLLISFKYLLLAYEFMLWLKKIDDNLSFCSGLNFDKPRLY